MSRGHPLSRLFPYPTLFRSASDERRAREAAVDRVIRRLRLAADGSSARREDPRVAGAVQEEALERTIARRLRLALFERVPLADRKSTRLNSSHLVISYAVCC